MDIFVVVMEGVYRHDITGVYDSLDLAIEGAKEACEKESDDYHDFVILGYLKNRTTDDGVPLGKVMRKDVGRFTNNCIHGIPEFVKQTDV